MGEWQALFANEFTQAAIASDSHYYLWDNYGFPPWDPCMTPACVIPPSFAAAASQDDHPNHLDLADLTQDNFFKYAKDGKSCMRLQEVFKNLESDAEKFKLALGMKGHIWEAIADPNANHVVQTIIVNVRAHQSQFIIEEIRCETAPVDLLIAEPSDKSLDGKPSVVVAKHRFGCRVIQRLLEQCDKDQLRELVADLTGLDAMTLCQHKFGNYVMWKVFELTNQLPAHVEALVRTLIDCITEVGVCNNGVAVLKEALEHATADQQKRLAAAILDSPELLPKMAATRHGNSTIRLALDLDRVDEDKRDAAVAVLLNQRDQLRKMRYGRAVVAFIEEMKGIRPNESETTPKTSKKNHANPADVSSSSSLTDLSPGNSMMNPQWNCPYGDPYGFCYMPQYYIPPFGVPPENSWPWPHADIATISNETIITKDNIRRLSRHSKGSWRIQEQMAEDTESIADLVEGLHGHVWEALRCPHANYVIQAVIQHGRPEEFTFILKELLRKPPLEGVCDAARHRYGCRIVQRLIEAADSHSEDFDQMFDDLIHDAVDLSSNKFGVYVVQVILESPSILAKEYATQLINQLMKGIPKLCNDSTSHIALGAALQDDGECVSEDRCKKMTMMADLILDQIITAADVKPIVATRHGYVAVKNALEKASTDKQKAALAKLQKDKDRLGKSRYGRVMVEILK